MADPAPLSAPTLRSDTLPDYQTGRSSMHVLVNKPDWKSVEMEAGSGDVEEDSLVEASADCPYEVPWKGVLPKEKVGLIQSSYKEVTDKVTADGFGKLFYQTLFEMAPAAKDLFKMNPEVQEKMFAKTLTLLVHDIDNAEKAVPVLLALATRHVAYGVQEAHFPVVGAGLLSTLKHVLGPSFTAPVEEAWTELSGRSRLM